MKEKEPQKSLFIDKGSYGCVFTPPLPCKKSKVAGLSAKMVGKITQKVHAEFEVQLTSIIEGIPGGENYFIVQEEDNCTSKNFEQLRKHYEKNCSIFKLSKDKNLTQLVSHYGGNTLLTLSIDPTFDFLGNLKHMLEGGALLQKQGICHYDIKEGNILVDMHGTFRFIDFGASFLADTLTEKNIWHQIYAGFLPEYPPQPPELCILDGYKEKMDFHDIFSQIITKKSIFKIIENIFQISKQTNEDRLVLFWMEQEEWKGDNWLPFFHRYWPVFDSWAIGVIFIKFLVKCFLHRQFVDQVWSKHKDSITKVMTGLLHVDPRKRLTCADALSFL